MWILGFLTLCIKGSQHAASRLGIDPVAVTSQMTDSQHSQQSVFASDYCKVSAWGCEALLTKVTGGLLIKSIILIGFSDILKFPH